MAKPIKETKPTPFGCGEKEAIHCSTKELAIQVIAMAYKLGHKWHVGDESSSSWSKIFCNYSFHKDIIISLREVDCQNLGYTITSAEDFIEHHSIAQHVAPKATKPKATRPKVYISGRVTGLDKAEVEQKFAEAKELLTKWGFTPVSPLDSKNKSEDWNNRMITCLQKLNACDGIYLLRDAGLSKGAKIEIEFASTAGMFQIKHLTHL